MLNSIPITSLTHQEFTQQIFSVLGKGHIHAGMMYEEFFRTGIILGNDPAFKNAKSLFEDIHRMIDFSMPSLIEEKSDGVTGKVLLRTIDHFEIESVLIPMQAGGTLCVSSQVGCRMGCAFCETGRMGLLRNLTTAEIVSQVFIARHVLHFDFRNIVFMGMGEPFDNSDAVFQAISVLQDPKGLSFGRKNITISTSGRIDGIERMILEGEKGPNLAVSINAASDEVRNRLMPINKQYNMAALHEAMKKYNLATKRDILIAYVLIKNQNDSLAHADQLAAYLLGLNVKINLIPYNPQNKDRFSPSEEETINAFAQQLRQHHYQTLIRKTKGQQIMAACGQLGNVKLRREIKSKTRLATLNSFSQ